MLSRNKYLERHGTNSMHNIVTMVCLRGGLGNQLFQYSYALSHTHRRNQIGFITDIGMPNSNSRGAPELFDLIEESSFKKSLSHNSWILRKILNFSLRKRSQMESSLFLIILEKIGSGILFLRVGQWYRVQSGFGVGYHKDRTPRKRSLVNGYFQSYKWVSIEKITESLSIASIQEAELEPYLEEANSKRILGVHVRMGDYALFDEFGVLPRDYYVRSLAKMRDCFAFDVIWLFSNDLGNAREFIPEEYKAIVREIPPEFTSVQTLQLMRLAHGYVIANSTFSWWGARLSHNASAPVISPRPWFRGMEEPNFLIPSNWERIQSWES